MGHRMGCGNSTGQHCSPDQQSNYGQQGHLHQQDHLEQQARNRNNAPQPLNQPLGDDAVNNPEDLTRDIMRKNYFVRMDYIV